MRIRFLQPALLALLTSVAPVRGDDCKEGYTLCAPAGASSTTTPQIGSPEFQNLLTDILSSHLPSFSKRSTSVSSASLCCVSSLSCLTLVNLALPFCYDKFTTNFLLPDNSFGTVATGQYSSSNSDKADLLTGDYTLANGQQGNIYANNPAAKPNTEALPLPPQFTGSGVGSAIPATALGGVVTLTYTTILPATVIPATVVSPTTILGSTVSTVEILPETISTQVSGSLVLTTVQVTSAEVATAPASIVQGTTRGATTIPSRVTTITTTQIAPASPAATTSKKSWASRSGGAPFNSLVSLLVMIGFLLRYW